MARVKTSAIRGGAVALLIVSPPLIAGEYVPPPTGPYQSSVVIRSDDLNLQDSSSQVYKFPSDDLIQQQTPSALRVLSEQKREVSGTDSSTDYRQTMNGLHQYPRSAAPALQSPPPMARDVEPLEPRPQQVVPNPIDSRFSSNPWAAEMQPNPNAYQGVWGNQQYNTPQQYPYGRQYQNQNQNQNQYQNQYQNQNNYMNAPFNSMPTPWSTMPMQPFFSGR